MLHIERISLFSIKAKILIVRVIKLHLISFFCHMVRQIIKSYITLLIVFLFTSSNLIFAQNTQEYIGPLRVGSYAGDAKYSYTIKNQDTILNGDFIVQRSNLQELIQQQDYSFLFKGAYIDDVPNGPWKFQFADFNSKSKTEVVDYQYRVLVSGTQEVATGNIVDGKPNGKWVILVEEIEDSEISKTLFESSILFKAGVPQQNFSIKNNDYTLVGRFLRNGLAQDEWSLFPTNGTEQTESWFFKDGLLESIKINNDSISKNISVFSKSNENTKIVNLDESYLKALSLQFSEGDFNIFQNEGLPRLLSQNTKEYQRIDDILSEIGTSDFLPDFKVKVPFYPLDSSEVKQLERINSNYKKAKELSSKILNNSHLNILKLSDKKIHFQYATVQKITSDYLNPLQEIVIFDSLGVLEYTNRNALVAHTFPNGLPKKTLDIEMKIDSTVTIQKFTFPNSSTIIRNNQSLETFEVIALMAYEGINDVAAELKEAIAQESEQNELIALEEQIITQNDSLVNRIDSLIISVPNRYKNALEGLKTFATKTLNDYSNIKIAQQKLGAARNTLICLKRLNSLAITVGKMPENWKTIEENYKDRIWNPFMATLMDEEVKKRITDAYNDVLVPYFLQEIENRLSCENSSELNEEINSSFSNIIELRNQDTKKLERKLRREKNPKVVLELLNMQNSSKE